ncbi:MAG: hypothetical protein P1U87_10635 [Verrucomicrobiales bacterium]|nr:hypothetical protein [Verrucomicrobiales bacterium]
MKTKLSVLLLLAFSLCLGACKHRNKNCCVCSGKAVVACPVGPAYGYQK